MVDLLALELGARLLDPDVARRIPTACDEDGPVGARCVRDTAPRFPIPTRSARRHDIEKEGRPDVLCVDPVAHGVAARDRPQIPRVELGRVGEVVEVVLDARARANAAGDIVTAHLGSEDPAAVDVKLEMALPGRHSSRPL